MQHVRTLLSVLAALALCATSASPSASQSDELSAARRRFEALAPDEQALIQERWQRYQALPEEEQRELALRAQQVKELRERAERALPAPLRARVQQLSPQQRERILAELVENETARIGARMRAALPPDVVQSLEAARPEDRARFFAQYQRRMHERVTRYMIERLGARLGLTADEIESLKQQPEDQRAARVLELRQRLTQAEARELGLPPGLTQEQWESWLKLPPEEFFERLAEHVRERQLAGADPGIGRGGARSAGASGLPLARIRALRRLQEAAQLDPEDLVELADMAPEPRRERVEERARQRCLAILDEGELMTSEELARLRHMDGPAFADALAELLAPLRAHWKPPEAQ
jgi:hypothetical protein